MDVKQRFLQYVNKTLGCWEWVGNANTRTGRAYFKLNGRNRIAARVSYEIFKGEIPRGFCVLHTCDNNKCVNPEHLYIGSQLDNIRDRVDRGRDGHANRTHCPQGHEYTEVNTYRFGPNKSYRACRACLREASSRYKKRHSAKEY